MTRAALPELFAQALELDEAARHALLEETAGRDPELARELERLLASSGDDPSPIDRSPWAALDPSTNGAPPIPGRIGPYRVLREIGRGGMARVFLAEEATELFRRELAVKVLDRAPFDETSIRRFQEEVRLLSALEHPGIARFLDGGQTDDGLFYLALEHVDGEDIVTWARERSLGVRERVELFLAALEPLRYAHARGVVHRDLKPGHLLVDRDGRPRLLDFGISKLVDPEGLSAPSTTRTETRALTPAYASPEQFRGEPVSPASDVYALGVILCELLAGRRPFAELQGTAAAFERAVLEKDPEPPSRLTRRTGSEDVGAPPGERGVPRGALPRDLDSICLKALRKIPSDRYFDADALASDLERFLRQQPVDARRGEWRYRLSRQAHRYRHRLALGAASAVAAAAIVVALSYAHRAAPQPPAPQPFPFSKIAGFDLEDLRSRFATAPEDVDAGATLALRLIRKQAYDEAKLVLARMRQIPGQASHPLSDYVEAEIASNAGEPQRALVHLTRARDAALALGRGDLLPQIRATRGRLLATLGLRDEAGAEMRLALADFEAAGDHASISRVLNDLAIEHLERGDFEEGRALLERAIAEAEAAGNFPGTMRFNLASLQRVLCRPDLAEKRLRELVAERREGTNRQQLGMTLGELALALRDEGKVAEARAVLAETLTILRDLPGTGLFPDYLHLQADSALEGARLQEVTPIAAELRGISESAGGSSPLALALDLEARRDGATGKLEGMRRRFREARTLLEEAGKLDQVVESFAAEALAELRAGHAAEAERAAFDAESRLPPATESFQPIVLSRAIRVRALVDLGRAPEATALLAAGPDASDSPAVTVRVGALAARSAVARGEGRTTEALRDLESAISTARDADRKLDELDLRLERARLDATSAGHSAALSELRALAREAQGLGLTSWVERARRLERELLRAR